MATFKFTVFKERMRADRTWNVFIRFTHERKTRYIATTMYVSKKDLTPSFKIKNQAVIDKCEDLIREYRKRIASLNLELNDMDIDSIVEELKRRKDENKGIDFVAFAREWCRRRTDIKGVKNYMTAINSLCMFFGRDKIFCSEITVNKMREFEDYLQDRKRAQSLYPQSIQRIFNEAREYYNDEENGIVRIRQSLSRYKPKQQNVAEKRAVDAETVRRIYDLPYLGNNARGQVCRHDLAKDCFLLSFCLMGMNSADLFNAEDFDGENIVYYRTKTKDRRNDHARMVVKVHPFIRPLVEKYRGTRRVFNFSERFSSMADLNRSINIGLKEVGERIGVSNLQYYAARHSMATIAVNKAGINKWLVNEMLCHTDSLMRVTDLYIEKDFGPVNEANFRLIDYVFGVR